MFFSPQPLRWHLFIATFLTIVCPAWSTIQPLHWYRMGDSLISDPLHPADTPGSQAATLHDSIGTLDLAGSAPYATIEHPASPLSSSPRAVQSDNCLVMAAPASLFKSALLSTDVSNFGFEVWINPDTAGETACIASNGISGKNGWAIHLNAGVVEARIGAQTIRGTSIFPNQWCHLAFIRGSISPALPPSSRLIVNGSIYSSDSAVPLPPTGSFTLGAALDSSGQASSFFSGALDEARYFRIISWMDIRNDLLRETPKISVTSTLNGENITFRNGDAIDFGTADTSFGISTYFRAATAAASLRVNVGNAAVHGPDAGEFRINFSSRADASGSNTPAQIGVICRPTSPGPKSAFLVIDSNDAISSPFVIQLKAVVVPGAYDSWKLAHFGTMEKTGDAADEADPNHNGLPNLLEYALGGDPSGNVASSASPLRISRDEASGRTFVMFPKNSQATDVYCWLEGSDTLENNSWATITESFYGAPYQASQTGSDLGIIETDDTPIRTITVSGSSLPRFLRLGVQSPP